MELSLDLGIRNTGWSIFRDGMLLDFGVWRTKPVKAVIGQISEQAAFDAFVIACGFRAVFDDYPEITQVIAELPGGSKSAKAAASMKMATGVAIGACGVKGFYIKWISPRNVKLYALGNPEATKRDIMGWVRDRYGAWAPKAFPKAAGEMEHIADSIAAYNAYKQLHGESLRGEAKNATIGSVPGRSGRSCAGKKAILRGRVLPSCIRHKAPRPAGPVGRNVVTGMDQGARLRLKKTGGRMSRRASGRSGSHRI